MKRSPKNVLAFEMDGEVIVVSARPCPQCAGTGKIEDYDSHMPPLIDAIEFRREQYGWTAMKMAAELGMARSHYSEFVKGKRRLPLEARIKAHELGVPASILLQP